MAKVALLILLVLGMAKYERIRITGETSWNGIYDPSIEYTSDGSVGWLAYSAIEGDHRLAGPFVHTRLAKSIDHGKTWRSVKTINQSHRSELTWIDGSKLEGVWRYEVPALVCDPTDSGKEWKLFYHRYFWNKEKDRIASHGWIAYKYANDPGGPWSKEIALFGAGKFPPAPYDKTRVRINDMHADLQNYVAYTEPGAITFQKKLYLSLTALKMSGPDTLILLLSDDHAHSWNYGGILLDRKDAEALGYKYFDGSSLVPEAKRTFLLTSPCSKRAEHDGTLIFEFEDLAKGKLKRDRFNKLIIHTWIQPDPSFLSRRGGGQSDYDPFNDNGGVLFPQFRERDYPQVFQIYQTRERIVQK